MGVSPLHSVSNVPSFPFYNPGRGWFSQSIRSFLLCFSHLCLFLCRSCVHLFFPSPIFWSWWFSTKWESPNIVEPGCVVVPCVEKIYPVFSVDFCFHFSKIPSVVFIPHPMMKEVVVNEFVDDGVHPHNNLVPVFYFDRDISVFSRNPARLSIKRNVPTEFNLMVILCKGDGTCRCPQASKPFHPFL